MQRAGLVGPADGAMGFKRGVVDALGLEGRFVGDIGGVQALREIADAACQLGIEVARPVRVHQRRIVPQRRLGIEHGGQYFVGDTDQRAGMVRRRHAVGDHGGDALAGGGVARHSLEGEGGFYYKGLGLRLNGTWGTPTTVRASGLPGSSDLRFGSVAKLNLRGFFDLGQLPAAEHTPFLKGARLAFGIGNLFNQRQRVTDGNGLVPLAYQPALIDPLGRTFNLELRKLF